jgi:sodium/hydrogen exchanger 8
MTASLSEAGISAYFVLFSALLSVVLVLSKFLHDRPRLASLLPEAGMILVVGVVCGAIVNLLFIPDSIEPEQQQGDDDAAAEEEVAVSLLSFSNEVFFLFLLPPIIFNSGYHLRKELFFRHITPICMLAVIGTTVSAFAIAFVLQFVKQMGWLEGREDFHPTFTELLTFGALISATDPVSTLAVFQVKRVDPQLFYLVFGESVLNDAVGLVLFNAFSKFVVRDNGAGKVAMGIGTFLVDFMYDSICSPILGLALGLLAALIFKQVDMRETKLLEICLYIMIMYVPFLVAEVLNLSGIVTILFTGMAARAYVTPNLSPTTADNANLLFRVVAHLAETSIFLELGLSVFGMKGSFYGPFILWSLLACLIGRALNVYPLVFIYNNFVRERGDGDSLTNDLSRPSHHGTRGGKGVTQIELSNMGGSQTDNGLLQGGTSPPSDSSQHGGSADDTTFTNMVHQDLKIPPKTAHMLWFSGLRGAVAYACVRSFPDTFHHDDEFTVTTMVIVLITVFGLGSTTESVLNFLKIEMNVDETKYMEAWHTARSEDGLILRFEELVQQHVIRPVTPLAVDTSDSHQPMAGDDVSIASGFRHHHDEYENGLDASNSSRHETRRQDSVFDHGKK